MSWQELLWAIPSGMGWRWYALWGAVAFVAASIMFFTMILRHEFSALLVSRVVLGLGLVLIPLCTIQSGWQPYVPAFYAVGGLLSALLIATGWCNRTDRSLTVTAALWRWARGRIAAAVAWLAGPMVKRSKREDAL